MVVVLLYETWFSQHYNVKNICQYVWWKNVDWSSVENISCYSRFLKSFKNKIDLFVVKTNLLDEYFEISSYIMWYSQYRNYILTVCCENWLSFVWLFELRILFSLKLLFSLNLIFSFHYAQYNFVVLYSCTYSMRFKFLFFIVSIGKSKS